MLVKVDRALIYYGNGFHVYLVRSQLISKVNVPEELGRRKISLRSSEEPPTFTV